MIWLDIFCKIVIVYLIYSMTDTHWELPEDTKVPKHVAIIPDGNRRWARARNLPTFDGHKKGFEITPQLARASREFGIHTLTIWAFSTENWNRSQEEVVYLMKMYEWFIDQHLDECIKDEAKLVHLGRKDRIPAALRKKIEGAEEKTRNFTRNILNVALDYGGHDELLRAIEKLHADLAAGKIKIEDMGEVIGQYHGKYPYYRFIDYLDTAGQPHPYVDLLIRTSGEQRVSGFLSWQLAYTEFYWEKDHFPDFTPEKLREAIIAFSNRQRRFGGN